MSKQLYVRTSSEYLEEWNKERIVNALIRETYLDRRTAEQISDEVETQIIGLNIRIMTSTLIRELVSAKLIEHGLEKAHKMHTRLGVALYDVEQIILHQRKHQAEFLPGPELTNLSLASRIKREYALINVFSQEVADAHLRGDMYLDGLECIDRLYSIGLSLEYLKKFGMNFFEGGFEAKPAKHPEALISQMVGFTDMLRGYCFHAVEWDALNILFAPYAQGVSAADLKQLAQKLVFELSRQAHALRVPALLHLYWHVPAELEETPALGMNEKIRTKAAKKRVYGDFLTEAQGVMLTLLDVLHDINEAGKLFATPLPVIHLSDAFFQAQGYGEFLAKAAEYLLKKGQAVFVFERGQHRRAFQAFQPAPAAPREAWKTRHAVINSVAINLPRFGYIAHRSDMHLFAKLTETMELAAEAHMQKRVFIEKLLASGREGPLGMLMMKPDGSSFLRLEEAHFLMDFVGMNELIQIHKGTQMHESDDAVNFGLEIIAHTQSVCERLSQRHHIAFALSGMPNPAASSRLARLDLRYYSPDSGHIVKGELGSGAVWYCDGIYMNPAAPYPLLKRMQVEGMLSRYLSGGAMSQVVTSAHFSQKREVIDALTAAFRETELTHLYFLPDPAENLFNWPR